VEISTPLRRPFDRPLIGAIAVEQAAHHAGLPRVSVRNSP